MILDHCLPILIHIVSTLQIGSTPPHSLPWEAVRALSQLPVTSLLFGNIRLFRPGLPKTLNGGNLIAFGHPDRTCFLLYAQATSRQPTVSSGLFHYVPFRINVIISSSNIIALCFSVIPFRCVGKLRTKKSHAVAWDRGLCRLLFTGSILPG